MTFALKVGVTLLSGALLLPPSVHTTMHDLQANRATLVLRDETHVAVTMFITYSDAMRRALAPDLSPAQFVLTYAAMDPLQFRRQLELAQRRFASATALIDPNGQTLALGNWTWPAAETVHAVIRELAMAYMVVPGEHDHEPPMEIHADANASRAITAVTIRFPPQFQRVLVVSYRPSQIWVEPTRPGPRITF